MAKVENYVESKFISKGNTKHGYWKTPTYKTWGNMVSRCSNENNPAYSDYGGRGITVCERWKQFSNFLSDMGEKPKELTLERIENDKGYYQANCKWANRIEQANNKRNNAFLEFNGQTQTLAQWERELGFKRGTIYDRLKIGWSIEKVLTTKARNYQFAQ